MCFVCSHVFSSLFVLFVFDVGQGLTLSLQHGSPHYCSGCVAQQVVVISSGGSCHVAWDGRWVWFMVLEGHGQFPFIIVGLWSWDDLLVHGC